MRDLIAEVEQPQTAQTGRDLIAEMEVQTASDAGVRDLVAEKTVEEQSKPKPSEGFNLGRYLVEDIMEPTIEAGVSLAGGMASYIPSKLYGLAGMAAGRDPREAVPTGFWGRPRLGSRGTSGE